MRYIFSEKDITINDGWVYVERIGRVALWWKYYDKQVTVDNSIGNSFTASNEEEVKNGILNLVNGLIK